MKISQPTLIVDPYEWLPGYGESRVSFRSVGPDVIVDVEYEKEIVVDGEEVTLAVSRKVVFKSVRCFIREPFPGGGAIFEFEGNPGEFRPGKLTEFKESEWLRDNLKVWRSVSSHEPPKLRHFSIQFLSENIIFHVLAADVFLSDEVSDS
ncbi:hypothetical protein [Pseudomonas trivialis]|uniref:Uncharacterized protein n=1 Tax=Pseudomonas trivialis TaxID=200450 RepID=A0ABY0U449_9PSED|nr:hypothetical protein [Pseudomonas trivialis]SDS03821.1 hypothetical protein SAMN04490205_1262 [Pseudomonas trivialis]